MSVVGLEEAGQRLDVNGVFGPERSTQPLTGDIARNLRVRRIDLAERTSRRGRWQRVRRLLFLFRRVRYGGRWLDGRLHPFLFGQPIGVDQVI